MKNINRYYLMFLVIFILIYIANIITPVVFDDDFLYAQSGNPFVLQWEEYLNWHGRYLTHTIGRIILQWKDPLSNLFTTLLVLLLTFSITNFINPNFWKNDSSMKISPTLFTLSMIFACLIGSWTTYTETTQVFAYHLTYTFILFFLFPYFQLLQHPKYHISRILIFTMGIMAGNSHEQAISIIIIILLIYIYLHYKQLLIPQWFYYGSLGLLLGITLLLMSPATTGGSRTGGIAALFDVTQYFEAIINIVFLNTYAWGIYGMPAFVLFGIFFYKNIKIEKDWLAPVHIIPLLMFLFSWGCIGILIVSPENYYGRTANFGLFFLYISVGLVLRSHLALNLLAINLINKLALSSTILALSIYLFFIPIWFNYYQQYHSVINKIELAKQQNSNFITISPFSQYKIQTPFGAIIPLYIHLSPRFYQRMATFYEIDSIIVEQNTPNH